MIRSSSPSPFIIAFIIEAFLRDMPAPSPEEAWARDPGEIAKAVEVS